VDGLAVGGGVDYRLGFGGAKVVSGEADGEVEVFVDLGGHGSRNNCDADARKVSLESWAEQGGNVCERCE